MLSDEIAPLNQEQFDTFLTVHKIYHKELEKGNKLRQKHGK
jgi:hypothetical protein